MRDPGAPLASPRTLGATQVSRRSNPFNRNTNWAKREPPVPGRRADGPANGYEWAVRLNRCLSGCNGLPPELILFHVEQPLPKNVTAFYLRTQGEAGQTLAEFSLVLALVTILCVVIVTGIGLAVVGFFADLLPAFV